MFLICELPLYGSREAEGSPRASLAALLQTLHIVANRSFCSSRGVSVGCPRLRGQARVVLLASGEGTT